MGESPGGDEMADRETITLSKTPDGWMATSESYRELFGANTIPTAFTERATAQVVLREIRRLNPAMHVVLA
jgi:hypothetical protein